MKRETWIVVVAVAAIAMMCLCTALIVLFFVPVGVVGVPTP